MYSYSRRLKQLDQLGLVNLKVVLVEGDEESKLNLLSKPEITIKNDSGFLLACDPGVQMHFALIAKMTMAANQTSLFEATGASRQIQRLTDKTPGELLATFIKLVPTHPDKEGSFVTKDNDFQNNNFWLMNTADGKLQMWQIGIVTNVTEGYSKYYLSLQLVYSADMYMNDADKNDVHIFIPEEQYPNYAEWLDLEILLHKVVDVPSLKPASDYKPPEPKFTKLNTNQCEVIWFNQCRRYGLGKFQSTMRGRAGNRTAIIHASEIKGQEFPALSPGQLVNFKTLRPNRQRFELIGVTE
jgi:hypothetical protein